VVTLAANGSRPPRPPQGFFITVAVEGLRMTCALCGVHAHEAKSQAGSSAQEDKAEAAPNSLGKLD
jgi:hypothetical protein